MEPRLATSAVADAASVDRLASRFRTVSVVGTAEDADAKPAKVAGRSTRRAV